MSRFVIISGCSGGGKSTLLAELARRGHAVVEEPGRRVVEAQQRCGGTALPWLDRDGFLREVIDLARADYAAADQATQDWIFSDRALVDALVTRQALTEEPLSEALVLDCPYHTEVFLAPPWPEHFVQDAVRCHGFAEAVVEFERLVKAYPALGYRVTLLPKAEVGARADLLLARLAECGQ